MSTRAQVAYMDEDGMEIISTYNHSDGYPENLGKALLNHYNTDPKAEERFDVLNTITTGWLLYDLPFSGLNLVNLYPLGYIILVMWGPLLVIEVSKYHAI